MRNKKYVVLLVIMALAACASPVGRQDSGIKTPSLWSRLVSGPNKPVQLDDKQGIEQEWWKRFNDPALSGLIAEALQHNKTLAIAKARVEEARAIRKGERSGLFPQIDGTADISRGNLGLSTAGKAATVGNAGIEASWELDLFGKNQARTAAAEAMLQSEEAMQQAVKVALLAEVAHNYFDIRNFERQIEITRQNLDNQKKTLELTEAQLQGAIASDFDVQRAAAQVSTTESQLPSLQTARDAALNRLNVLIGAAPGEKDEMMKSAAADSALDPQILISAPAAVLAARPDIRAAERRFAASISASDAATRELFPTISLLGLFGAQDTNTISTTPTWNAGAGLVLPILNFGRIQANIDAADARQQQAFLSYQQTVLESLEDMENALSGYLHETERNASLANAATQNRKAVELAKQRYTSGYNGLLDVLVVERNALDAESNLVASDAMLRKNLVNIYAAAGGGWAAP